MRFPELTYIYQTFRFAMSKGKKIFWLISIIYLSIHNFSNYRIMIARKHFELACKLITNKNRKNIRWNQHYPWWSSANIYSRSAKFQPKFSKSPSAAEGFCFDKSRAPAKQFVISCGAAMSRVTKLKHVKRENQEDDFSLPNDKQHIVRVMSSKGNNLHEVESENEEVNWNYSDSQLF